MRLTAPCLCVVIALCLGAPPALAEDVLPPTSQFFDEYDTNADGKVMPDEFGGSSEVFRLLDKNGDGAISPDELGLPADYKPDPRAKKKRPGGAAPAGRGGDGGGAMAKRLEQMRKRIQAMDVDKDGRVSQDEWKGPEQAFARVDRNRDGFIDAKDYARMGGDRRPGKGDRKGDRKGGGDRANAERMRERAKGHFTSLDKNGDGKLTADEAPNPKLLEMADADQDGGVTLEEFLAAMEKRMRARAGEGRPRDGRPGRDGKGGRGRGRMSTGMLRRWDRDGDGKVSAQEFPGRDELFTRFDLDGDGFLTEADVEAVRAKRAGKSDGKEGPTTTPKGGNVIEQQDTDGDGKLNRAEFKGPNSVWRLLDRNGDGWITADELKPQTDR